MADNELTGIIADNHGVDGSIAPLGTKLRKDADQ
jgi:hypothetical protein